MVSASRLALGIVLEPMLFIAAKALTLALHDVSHSSLFQVDNLSIRCMIWCVWLCLRYSRDTDSVTRVYAVCCACMPVVDASAIVSNVSSRGSPDTCCMHVSVALLKSQLVVLCVCAPRRM
jgi:hypothetical protein